jgi:hypothetical protein
MPRNKLILDTLLSRGWVPNPLSYYPDRLDSPSRRFTYFSYGKLYYLYSILPDGYVYGLEEETSSEEKLDRILERYYLDY